MRVDVTGYGSDLQGVGRLPDGRCAFVPGALEGETVDVRITRDKGRYCEAELISIVTPSGDRIAPTCKNCAQCGGCPAAIMSYQASLEAKKSKVVQALRRVGGFQRADVSDVLGMSDPFRYRNKAEYAISRGRIGLRAPQSREIVEIDDCLLQSETSVRAMKITRGWLAGRNGVEGWLVTRVNGDGELMCCLSTREKPSGLDALAKELFREIPGMRSIYFIRLNNRPANALDGVCSLVAGAESIKMKLCGLEFMLGPMSFFQVNSSQAEKLYALAVGMADLNGAQNVVDAYCGVGSITLNLALNAKSVTGVESISQAVADARINAKLNGLSEKTEFIAADAAKEIPRLVKSGRAFDTIVVDPPRKGVDQALISAALQSGAKRIVYVSCDPATLARDMAEICSTGEYEMQKVTPVDMFAWTSHIETVVLMSRTK